MGGGNVAGTKWVAQIVYGAANTKIGPPMSFRPQGTLAGAWVPTSNGGSNDRILEGVLSGQTAILTVRVWDSNVFASWEEASQGLSAGVSPVKATADSSTFNYTVPPAGTTDPSQFNLTSFNGFQLTCNCYQGPPVAVPVRGPARVSISNTNGFIALMMEAIQVPNRVDNLISFNVDTSENLTVWQTQFSDGL
jgi:hypothetical protein